MCIYNSEVWRAQAVIGKEFIKIKKIKDMK